ncbi:unnamed protein product [Caenorhabditis auriculariae]|uniref:Reverse transcriptase domain-containing protein n=1 Tax=Caenorhabditis auriculariae TaxID=2777116 RepID=A0A8S1H3P9_9PELO|nr:unnamed protein product [Caenorhabditis auriculariae]
MELGIPIGKGVRQGDTISPKLFSTALEGARRQLGWDEEHDWEDDSENICINIDSKILTNLHFANDIVISANNTTDLSTMLNDLNVVGKTIGLTLNLKRTQWTRNSFCDDGPVTLEGEDLQQVDSYVYLGKEVNILNDLKTEI